MAVGRAPAHAWTKTHTDEVSVKMAFGRGRRCRQGAKHAGRRTGTAWRTHQPASPYGSLIPHGSACDTRQRQCLCGHVHHHMTAPCKSAGSGSACAPGGSGRENRRVQHSHLFQKLGVERVEPGQKAPLHHYGLKKEMAQNSMELGSPLCPPTHRTRPAGTTVPARQLANALVCVRIDACVCASGIERGIYLAGSACG